MKFYLLVTFETKEDGSWTLVFRKEIFLSCESAAKEAVKTPDTYVYAFKEDCHYNPTELQRFVEDLDE